MRFISNKIYLTTFISWYGANDVATKCAISAWPLRSFGAIFFSRVTKSRTKLNIRCQAQLTQTLFLRRKNLAKIQRSLKWKRNTFLHFLKPQLHNLNPWARSTHVLKVGSKFSIFKLWMPKRIFVSLMVCLKVLLR